jgi:hypothetical protein
MEKKYKVSWRAYDPKLEERFGTVRGQFHSLTDAQVIAAIRKFGRASISEDNELEFENDYD